MTWSLNSFMMIKHTYFKITKQNGSEQFADFKIHYSICDWICLLSKNCCQCLTAMSNVSTANVSQACLMISLVYKLFHVLCFHCVVNLFHKLCLKYISNMQWILSNQINQVVRLIGTFCTTKYVQRNHSHYNKQQDISKQDISKQCK